MAQDETVTVKGSPVRSLQKFIESELSPAQRAAVFAALPPEYATRFKTTILATETLPVHMLNRFTEEAAKAKGEPIEEFAKRAGRAAAAEAVKGIYRFFALVLTPAALLSKGSQMWRSLYNRGEMKISSSAPNSARVSLLDFPSEIAGCSRITGWIEQIALLTGVKDVVVKQTRCFAKGQSHCEWDLNWK